MIDTWICSLSYVALFILTQAVRSNKPQNGIRNASRISRRTRRLSCRMFTSRCNRNRP
jgi:hypothetical protein